MRACSKSTMAVSLNLFLLLSTMAILLALVASTNASAESDKNVNSRFVGPKESMSSKNSSMAERSDEALDEHAVDNPDEIASMVDIFLGNQPPMLLACSCCSNLSFFSSHAHVARSAPHAFA